VSGASGDSLARSVQVAKPEALIRPGSQPLLALFTELWDYRELLLFLSWRDVLVRYKQAVLGVAWALIQPVVQMVIFSVIFGQLAKLPSEGVPYPVFTYVGLLPWTLFANALQRSGTSLVGSANLINKVYFPRLIIPLSALLSSLIDFMLASAVLVGLMFHFGVVPTANVVWLPVFVLLALGTALAAGLWLSALNVMYRDVQHVVPFLVQAWMFASPVAYSASIVPRGVWASIYTLNPMSGVIRGFRWALLGGQPLDGAMAVSVAAVWVLLVTGFLFFRRMERVFADVV
jgi:lipopolysaccharide transport system permease protein